jgi:threonine/homoserine/homoserine lactone efflux protein
MDIFLSAGITLGLSAGFSPGPLSTLVISHSLRYGTREGIKVAMAPFITDVPIVLLSVFVMAQLHDSKTAFGIISMIGAAVLFYLAYESFRVDKVSVETDAADSRSVLKGSLVNFLSPNPYLFWLTIGGPKVVEAWMDSALAAVEFLVGFYVCLVGCKVIMAIVAARSKHLLDGKAYRYLMRFLGVALIILAFVLLKEGLVFLAVLKP